MNSLIITLCILITAETEILLATNSSTISPEHRESSLLSSGVTELKAFPVAYEYVINSSEPLRESFFSFLYDYNYNTDTGIQANEAGYLNEMDTEAVLEVHGSYTYTDNENNTFKVSYVANENGFQPKGSHLPTVPPLIKKALQYIAEHSERNGKE